MTEKPQPGPARRLTWTDIPLERVPTPKGEMALHRSLTSGLCRRAGDPPGVFWGVGDRGPNIKPKDAVSRYGLDHLAPLAGIDGAKVMPLPEVGPALARFRLVGDSVELDAVLPLRASDGTLLDGLPPPPVPGAETEPAFALDGSPLPTSANGADSEGIAARPDGKFWIAEEYGPSLLLVDDSGLVELRLVPHGSAARYDGSAVPVIERLPALALARKLNRGFEALAASPGGDTLYVAFQSPLAHPDRAAHEGGTVVRIWSLDAASGAFQCEYAYPLDPPAAFTRDSANGPVTPGDVKVSEITCLSDGSLLVLERVTASTHIYRLRLPPPLPAHFIDAAHRPSLEQLGLEAAESLTLPTKQRLFSSDEQPQVCPDLEGLIVLDDGDLLLANDSDYGTEGAATQFWRVPNRNAGAER